MFDISFSELLLIGVVALVIIGPERLPKVARTVGHLLGRAQRYVNDVKSDIQREVELDDLRKIKEEMESAAHSMRDSLQDAAGSFKDSVSKPVEDLQSELDATAKDISRVMANQTQEPTAAETAEVSDAPTEVSTQAASDTPQITVDNEQADPISQTQSPSDAEYKR